MAPTVLVIVLLGGTATAFAVAERLKLQESPIVGPDIQRAFSPGCECPGRTARLSFGLQGRDRVTVTVLDADGNPIRTLADRLDRPRGRLTLHWDGRTDGGATVPDGPYTYRVELERKGRTLRLPFAVTVDTVPPVVRIVSALPRSLRAGVGRRAGRVKIRYRLSERARPAVFFRGRQVIRARLQRPRGQLDWYARSGGRALRPGVYRLRVLARDAAGNLSPPATVAVRVRPRRPA